MLTEDGWRRDNGMSIYRDVIYSKDDNNGYPRKLCEYLFNRFFGSKDRATLLDIGCSGCTHMKYFSELGLECRGIDLRVESISKFEIKECNVEKENIPYPDNYFDCVYSKSLVEHVVNIDNLFSNTLRVLKPQGIFVCMTPDWESQMSHFWDDYTHVHPFTIKSLRNALLINGFEDAECEYFHQLPFLWKRPYLKLIPNVINSVTSQNMKWKNKNKRNGEDNKLIRFSKEKMLLAYAFKGGRG